MSPESGDETAASPGFYEALGRTIQVLRTDRGLSRKDLAERAGISYSYLSAIENGDKPPSSRVMIQIAEALGVRTHELMAAAEARQDSSDQLYFQRIARSEPERRRWFSAPPAAAALRTAAPPAAPAPGRTPPEPQPPRSDLGALAELRQLLPRLDPDEVQIILDMARRLASK